jgi:Fe-S cluster assembly protein SufD
VALAGLAEVHGQHQAHQWLRVCHAAGNSTSEQLYKNVLHEQARTSFDGCVQIIAGADGANARQQNRNLVLADTARADTRPQLDIKADDVKAAHGATVGQLDADELLYLRMRGLPLAAARALLTTGFSGEVLALLPHPEFLP